MSARVIRSSAVVTLLSLLSMAATFFLQVFLAAVFGAGATTDAYLAAATLPTLANTVFLTAMNITFIPVFLDVEMKGSRAEAWTVANSFIAIVIIFLVVASLAGSLLSEDLIRLVAPGLGRDATTVALAASLQRILLPAMVLMACSGLLAGLFYAHQSFVIPSLAPVLANGVALLLSWLLSSVAGIYAIAIGVLAGNAVQVLFLVFFLRLRLQPTWQFNFAHPGLGRIARLMGPWLLGAMIYKANPVVDRVIASQFAAGAISILGYAAQLAQAAVFAASKGTSLAVFPTLSRLANSGQRSELPAVIDVGLRLILSIVAPLTVLLVVLGELIVAVIFQRGAFSPADVQQTALAVIAYGGSIIALAVGNVLTYVYYALQDTKTPAIVGSVGMALNLALALLLRTWAGFLAPAISFSIMTLFNLVVLSVVLRRRLQRIVLPGFFTFCARTVAAATIMAGVLLLTRYSIAFVPALAQSPRAVQLAYHVLVGLLCYVLLWFAANPLLAVRILNFFRQRLALPIEIDS